MLIHEQSSLCNHQQAVINKQLSTSGHQQAIINKRLIMPLLLASYLIITDGCLPILGERCCFVQSYWLFTKKGHCPLYRHWLDCNRYIDPDGN
ncbi:hypothetical protein EJ02DRAFT_57872 [Clathrospora elynae]|uniref:Uncharacterized protein n=1 Tax=Clathrospora elynae TaxID=706981 RepID=A0A6A5SCS1_9PLEO|nr:hypothetical protein EJ02DRAFT_57872 [Clathrospora elynae]